MSFHFFLFILLTFQDILHQTNGLYYNLSLEFVVLVLVHSYVYDLYSLCFHGASSDKCYTNKLQYIILETEASRMTRENYSL